MIPGTRLEIGNELQLDVSADLDGFLNDTLSSIQEIIVGEETKIVALLEEFVDQDVANKISTSRERVSDILGRGTTVAQTTQVRAFYREVRSILKDALKTHINARFGQFSDHLSSHANGMPENALSQVRARIEQTAIDIRAAAEAMVAGDKEAFKRASSDLTDAISIGKSEILTLMDDQIADAEGSATKPATEAAQPVVMAATEGSITDSIRARATRCAQRHVLQNGAKGWSFSRIFEPSYLQGASEGWLVDPYLALRFQRRNLSEFAMALLDGAKLKVLHVVTREKNDLPEVIRCRPECGWNLMWRILG
jgi:Phospholipase D-like domain at C-terminus of MIT